MSAADKGYDTGVNLKISSELNELFRCAEDITGATICVKHCSSALQAVILPEKLLHYHPWCRLNLYCDKNRCHDYDRVEIIERAKKTARPFIKFCHANVMEAVIPVYSGESLGTVLYLGQCRKHGLPSGETMKRLGDSGVSNENILSTYHQLKVVDERRLMDTALLLSYAVSGIIDKSGYSNETTREGVTYYVAQCIRFANASNGNTTLSRISDRIGVSREYLGRVFKRETGLTVGEYINTVRIKRAKILLANTDSSIEYVSENSGFDDPNYFSRVFKKKIGVTPSEYRNHLMKYEFPIDEGTPPE